MKCPHPVLLWKPDENRNFMEVPCGGCGACRHNRRSDWAFRLHQEEKNSLNSYFITLTYSDENLPCDDQTGVVTLRKKDLQNFIKRLRKHQNSYREYQFRYYAVGEYGTRTERPHYHLIGFNLHPSTITNLHYLWRLSDNPPHIGDVEGASIFYVAKFHMNAGNDDDGDREPEFATMSRRPGIGINYAETTGKWHRENSYNHIKNNGYKQRLPRYYKKKIFSLDQLEEINQQTDAHTAKTRWREILRLEKIAGVNPDETIKNSEIRQAKKIKDKKTDNPLF